MLRVHKLTDSICNAPPNKVIKLTSNEAVGNIRKIDIDSNTIDFEWEALLTNKMFECKSATQTTTRHFYKEKNLDTITSQTRKIKPNSF